MTGSLKVAIVQDAPKFLDLDGTLSVVERGLREAAGAGAELVAFGESFLSGYPVWLDVRPGAALWDHPPAKRAFAALRRSAVTVPGPTTEALSALCAELGLGLVIGAHERVEQGPGHGTLYNALLTFDADGALVNHHRKLVPTYSERMVWGPGDAAGLTAVPVRLRRGPAGQQPRVGGLICWEHWMPLARQALHETAEQIHVAVWPAVKDAHHLASRHYAFEGRCFVLAAGQLARAADLPDELRPPGKSDGAWLLDGGSAVYGPDGVALVEARREERAVLTAEIDLTRIDEESMTLDVTGHYHRPDVFSLEVLRRRPS